MEGDKIGELENGENERDGFYAAAEGSSSGVYTICKYALYQYIRADMLVVYLF